MRVRHLRAVDRAPRCRTALCDFAAEGELGFCSSCGGVYRAGLELREQLLARRSARVQARHPELFNALSPGLRRRLLAHIAAQPAQLDGAVEEMSGLEDFFGELCALSLMPGSAGGRG